MRLQDHKGCRAHQKLFYVSCRCRRCRRREYDVFDVHTTELALSQTGSEVLQERVVLLPLRLGSRWWRKWTCMLQMLVTFSEIWFWGSRIRKCLSQIHIVSSSLVCCCGVSGSLVGSQFASSFTKTTLIYIDRNKSLVLIIWYIRCSL